MDRRDSLEGCLHPLLYGRWRDLEFVEQRSDNAVNLIADEG